MKILLGWVANLLCSSLSVGAIAPFAPTSVVGVRVSAIAVREEVTELFQSHRVRLGLPLSPIHKILQAFLGHLPLENLLLDGPRCQKAVHVHVLLLPVSPHAPGGLFVVRRVPVRVEEDQPVSPDEIQPAAARFGAEQERKHVSIRVIELRHELHAGIVAGFAVQRHEWVPSLPAQLGEEAQGGSVIRDEHNAVLRVAPQVVKQLGQHGELPRHVLPALGHLSPPFAPIVEHSRGKVLVAVLKAIGGVGGDRVDAVVDEFGVVAELLQSANCGQDFAPLPLVEHLASRLGLQEVEI
mmetsp:Transcript_4896/g.13730  ORF Transcript_4896/g.13730 Transcript_4896/m.13730 type:complete len:296 (-) Transcript_4896:1502-2389(-)